MTRPPELLFVVDIRRESTAIHEANLLNIPVIALVDTNCDPRDVDYVIPSNDDAIRAIKLLVAKIADAAIEGKAMRKDIGEEELPPTRVTMAGAEEPELSDEELLGAATLAKISPRLSVVEFEEEVIEDEFEDIEEEEEVEVDEAALEAEGIVIDEADEVDETEVDEE
jgi:small subunit ribosomal protein S2